MTYPEAVTEFDICMESRTGKNQPWLYLQLHQRYQTVHPISQAQRQFILLAAYCKALYTRTTLLLHR